MHVRVCACACVYARVCVCVCVYMCVVDTGVVLFQCNSHFKYILLTSQLDNMLMRWRQ